MNNHIPWFFLNWDTIQNCDMKSVAKNVNIYNWLKCEITLTGKRCIEIGIFLSNANMVALNSIFGNYIMIN